MTNFDEIKASMIFSLKAGFLIKKREWIYEKYYQKLEVAKIHHCVKLYVVLLRFKPYIFEDRIFYFSRPYFSEAQGV